MVKPEGEVVVSCHDDGHFWEFRVRDNGPGIPKEHFDRVFELFQTLKPRDELEATGVGLAIAKRIVERHGGSIFVESTVGGGSHFKFTVPKDRDHRNRTTSGADTDNAWSRVDSTPICCSAPYTTPGHGTRTGRSSSGPCSVPKPVSQTCATSSPAMSMGWWSWTIREPCSS